MYYRINLGQALRWFSALTFVVIMTEQPVPVAARSKPYVCCRSPAEIVGSNPTGGMDVCRVLWGIGLCDELIVRPEESYSLWCVI